MADDIYGESNWTTISPPDDRSYPLSLGYAAASITVVLFGSNFVPVKKFETGDGVFFQLIVCLVIWICGLVVNAIRDFPAFHPLAMLGGFLWTTGNIMCVPIIKTIGLGQGMCIWASVSLITGWASGRFGWFGLTPEIPPRIPLNYVGASLCIISAFIYMLIKTNVRTVSEMNQTHRNEPISVNADENSPLLNNEHGLMNDSTISTESSTPDDSIFDRLPPLPKRLLGTIMACVAGLLFGVNFAPVIYIQDNYPEEKHKHGLDFVFAHFSGILVTSITWFAIYCMFMRNQPKLFPKAILPGMLSGIMWAIADIGWFIANDSLSVAISFPIITSAPPIVASLWGILFKEIRGVRNILVLLVAFAFAITGSVLTGISKAGDSTNSTLTRFDNLMIG